MKTMIIDDTNQPEQRSEASAKRSLAAERMRVFRKRRREGMRCLTLELREGEIGRLIDLGHLEEADRQDRNQVLLALYRFLDYSALGDPHP
jgi:hypothetical protein